VTAVRGRAATVSAVFGFRTVRSSLSLYIVKIMGESAAADRVTSAEFAKHFQKIIMRTT
jgi:hypothetical protein